MPLRVLVACERSGRVRNAFRAKGCDAWSCDLHDSDDGSAYHYTCSVLDILLAGWDVLIGHPPCTFLCTSGARWFDDPKYPTRRQDQADAIAFARALWTAPIPRICLENPRSVLSTQLCKPSQMVTPWDFGHAENKETFLWLKNLPLLQKKYYVLDEPVKDESRLHNFYSSNKAKRSQVRSETFLGLALAMADQWSGLPSLPTN